MSIQEVRLAAPAVVWASSALQGQPRVGRLIDDRLVLQGPEGLLILRTDLPLAGKQTPNYGRFLGLAGTTACMLAGKVLHLVNTNTGEAVAVTLNDLGGGSTPIDAFLDGPLVYVTGPGGIVGVNATTNQQVFHTAWPKGATPDTVAPVTPPAVGYVGGGQIAYPQQQIQYDEFGQPILQAAHGGVGQGRLYALVSPTRLVSLKSDGP